MNLASLGSSNRRSPLRLLARGRPYLLLACVILLVASGLRAQQANDSVTVDKQTLELMLQRIGELEARVRQLEADKQQAAGVNTFSASASTSLAASTSTSLSAYSAPSPVLLSSPAPAKSNAPLLMGSVESQSASSSQATPGQTGAGQQQEPETSQSENVMAERMDLSKTLLRIRGFGDVSLVGGNRQAFPPTNQPAQTTSFALGQLDLFTTSDISDKFKFIGEIVFEGGPDNIYGVTTGSFNTFAVDVERYIIQYSYNDYFNISAGRWHTGIAG